MAATYVLGIDGGGSNLRVVLTDAHLTICGQSQGGSTNPNVVGRDASGQSIREAIGETLASAGLSGEQIAGVGIGIAGASQPDFKVWLQQVVADVTPGAQLVISSDFEIALVGAHGKRRGVLVLAGTGSLAYGINSRGNTALVGGWGYLLGDEGSGYWLGMEALRAVLRMVDERGAQTSLTQAVFDTFQLQQSRDVVVWLYQSDTPRVRQIAELAPLVFAHAAAGDAVAEQIVTTGARELALAARTVLHRLDREPLPIAFTGSLLSTPNPLSNSLCALLGLPDLPIPRYSPALGAALLALDMLGLPILED
jgi:N-acetylglucosamine kinase-like BadF-type ATPase